MVMNGMVMNALWWIGGGERFLVMNGDEWWLGARVGVGEGAVEGEDEREKNGTYCKGAGLWRKVVLQVPIGS
jgi:hypothetical protein